MMTAWDRWVAEHGEEPTGEDRARIEREDAVIDLEKQLTSTHENLLRMSVRPGEAWTMYGLIRLMRPDTVVEIGRLEGISSEWILNALEANQKGHLDSIDIKTREESIPRLAPWAKKKMVTIHEFDSHGPKAAELASKLGTVDFLFVDGSHTPDAVEADCRLWLPRVRGYALFHDWSFEGVRVGIRRAIPLENFPRHVASNEHIAAGDTHIHSHGIMLLHLPDGLRSVPAERPGKPG